MAARSIRVVPGIVAPAAWISIQRITSNSFGRPVSTAVTSLCNIIKPRRSWIPATVDFCHCRWVHVPRPGQAVHAAARLQASETVVFRFKLVYQPVCPGAQRSRWLLRSSSAAPPGCRACRSIHRNPSCFLIPPLPAAAPRQRDRPQCSRHSGRMSSCWCCSYNMQPGRSPCRR